MKYETCAKLLRFHILCISCSFTPYFLFQSIGIGTNPLLLMIPTAVATSYAYMLPVATPPNAMVYVLGYFSMTEMVNSNLGILSDYIH